MKILRIIFCLLLFCGCFSIVKSKDLSWYAKFKQIEPLETTKTDLEKLFDNAKIDYDFESQSIRFMSYETENGSLSVKFSTGSCSSENTTKADEAYEDEINYKVGKDVILSAIFFIQADVKLSDLNIERSLFYKSVKNDDSALHYISDSLGLDYVVMSGKVKHIEVFPSFKYQNLQCENSKNYKL